MNKAKQNLYMEIADRCMNKAYEYRRRLKRHRADRRKLIEKYAVWEKQLARHKLVFILASISHLCLAILAGINLEDVFYAAQTSIENSSGMREALKATLPIAGILGLSLIVGMLLARIEPTWDAIIPKKLRLHRGHLIGSALGLVIYFAFLYHVIAIGIDMAPQDEKKVVQLILFFGILELFTGFFAASGWEIIYYQTRKYYYSRCIPRFSKMEKKWCMKSDHYYYYYLQTLPEGFMEPGRRTIQQIFPETEWGDY